MIVPRNEGIRPPYALVDIRYRNGHIVRGVDPDKRRWTLNDPAYPPNYAYDIVSWQVVGKGKAAAE